MKKRETKFKNQNTKNISFYGLWLLKYSTIMSKYLDMILIDPLWDSLEDEVDYDIYFGKKAWGERKLKNEKLKEVKITW